ncbi:sulfite reductase [Desulfobacter hydrogenophilus]|uniref:4Fe-4S dicluster domain-containing protein n=1 Tax=Desulfobacter hydrogenophilus TaxID=2291 RepID=A0A328FGM9_9BACT|nr:4Fe-4S dicluster domain-containing protein [Desulfobacter hydrogenophilus]NDY71855.1 4Fe-4S dicluster domain-containing protein [Desulfobacter hydrogenophilus]QBH12010.1 4Fe-4S dicluster domain-containing protein [Desulfobacter hydrogenophilus]RAM02632.1 sulfite reductase [Desulfobacter hydrogenophilus]
MKWAWDAEKEVSKSPFFVRKKVRKRIEKEAAERGHSMVSLDDVHATRKRFLSNMESEIKGYQIEACFGQEGCPNSCVEKDTLTARLEALLLSEDLLGFLQESVPGKLRFHHEFRISVSHCPNACSQPQIKDIGIIAAIYPRAKETLCNGCMSCVNVCKENAVALSNTPFPLIDTQACLGCGACIHACPTGCILSEKKGYRVLLGGRLGRHPRLARELPHLFTEAQVLEVVKACLTYYKKNSRAGQKFSALLGDSEIPRDILQVI